MLFVKAIGFILIVSSSTLIGALKSYQLKLRLTRLNEIYRSVFDLKERIRLNGGEIYRLIIESFGEGAVDFKDNGFKINRSGLCQQDINIIDEFLSNIGMSDVKAECDRTELYMTLILKQCDIAEKKCVELCKLYNTTGFLCGIFICIFLL